MYLPQHFAPEHPAAAWDLARAYPFGLLISSASDLAPLPWVIDRDRGVLRSHLAAANPLVDAIEQSFVSVVFQGPDGYISPTWYPQPRGHVPTWNYALAVARGSVERLSRARTRAVLWELCEQFEPADGYRPDWLDAASFDQLLEELVGVEVHVQTFVAKLKLSQNRNAIDRAGILRALAAHPYERASELLRWMQKVER